MNARSSALGQHPGLRAKGTPGDRVLRNAMEVPVLAEVSTGIWMPVMPCATWEQWRQLAQAILDTDAPAPEPLPAGAG